MENPQQSRLTAWLRSRTGVMLMVFLTIVAFYLFIAHTTHTLNVLPYVLLLLCPLLHLFMHGGHGGNHSHTG